jgi:hypothetical protein
MTKAELLADRDAMVSLILEAVARLEAVAKDALRKEEHEYARAFGRLEMAVEIECSSIRLQCGRLGEERSR